MPTTSSLGIRGRLVIGFGAVLLILIIAISMVLIKVTISKRFAEEVLEVHIPSVEACFVLNGQIYQSVASLHGWVLTHHPQFKSDLMVSWKNIVRAEEALDNFTNDEHWSSEDRQKWQEAKALLEQLKTLEMRIMNTSSAVTTIVPKLTTEILPLTNKIYDILDGVMLADGNRGSGIFTDQSLLLKEGVEEIASNMTVIQFIEYTVLIIGMIASLLISFYTIRNISQYIVVFRQHSNRVATGDLTQRIAITGHDEMGQLGQDLNTMTDSLAIITKQITEACQNIVTTIEEVSHSVNAQSTGASEQASSINQITASLEEIEKSSMQTMDKAKALGEAAEHTREQGQLGLEAVEQSINGMKAVRDKVQAIAQTILDLSNQTQQVGEITAVVNGLAQQLKMLALNASIEAAKAGEAGKGFAIVATEVKNLAEQSEQSTAQVQKILEDIRHATEKAVMVTEEGMKGVDHGTELVEQTGQVVRNLSEVIHDTTIATQQIEAAIRQEGIGIEQITTGMNEIHQVTSSSVEGVKQTTEAINDLVTIAKNLKKYTDIYKV
ncbi:MAG: methyl-accepting chemotaxis protein [Gammaproteobacteria bacterium]|nr:MAG: methyl-accepting chemotaxis protein [Gammaproteobacteria bacterium]